MTIEKRDWRTAATFPGYTMNPDAEVWSLPRQVPCKGGAMRQIAGRRIKPAKDGRVCLSIGGQRRSFHPLRDMYPLFFPDRAALKRRAARQRPQALCRRGHPLMRPLHPTVARWMGEPGIAYWGTDNRICTRCHGSRLDFSTDSRFSMEKGVSAPPPGHRVSAIPKQPKLGAHMCMETEDGSSVLGDLGYDTYLAYEASKRLW